MILFNKIRCLAEKHTNHWAIGLALLTAYAFVNLLLLLFILSSCDIDDDRDECCESVTIEYRYVRLTSDVFSEYIRTMRHFLFDAEKGVFIETIPVDRRHPQFQKLDFLPVGKYTMVTIANMTDYSALEPNLEKGHTSLEDFYLKLQHIFFNEIKANGDPLYWSNRSFEVKPQKIHHYISDLSNIHCRLHVKVTWQSAPPVIGDYVMELQHVPSSYHLNPEKAKTMLIYKGKNAPNDGLMTSERERVVHTFPFETTEEVDHRLTVPLHSLMLIGEFVTFRYTNERIPSFRLYQGGKPITQEIDLAKAFKEWDWYPDEHSEQIYKIELEIRDNGDVIVKQWVSTSVLDWEDGGRFQ